MGGSQLLLCLVSVDGGLALLNHIVRDGNGLNAAAHFDKQLRLVKLRFIFLHEFRGKGAKAILRQPHDQKIASNNVIHLTGFITERSIQRQTRELTFIVSNVMWCTT